MANQAIEEKMSVVGIIINWLLLCIVKRLTCILIGAYVFVAASCIKKGGRCEEVPTIENSSITLHITDSATGEYIYQEFQSPYNKDSFKVRDPQGNDLLILSLLDKIPGTLNNYYYMDFGPLFDTGLDEDSFERDVCKKYIIYYSANETDSLDICFRSRKEKCGAVFSSLKVYHHDQLISSLRDSISAHIFLKK